MTDETEQGIRFTTEQADKYLSNGFPQYKWYEDEAVKAERALARVTWAGILAGLAASALAAFPSSLLAAPYPDITRWLVAILTLFVTLFSTTLAGRYRRMAMEREKGRVETARLINLSRVALTFEPLSLAQAGKIVGSFERDLLIVDGRRGVIDFKTDEHPRSDG